MTTMSFPAKLVLLGGGARPRRDRRLIVSQGFITPRHRWRPQWCVVAGFLPSNSQAVRKKQIFLYAWDISDRNSNTNSFYIPNKSKTNKQDIFSIRGYHWLVPCRLFYSSQAVIEPNHICVYLRPVGSLQTRKEQRPADHQASKNR